ncbi:hypothetical protein ACWC24_36240 [Streptomyces sp. NPDC001443]
MPMLKPGQSGAFKTCGTEWKATVISVKYPTPAEVGTSKEAIGQYAVIRLTVTNTGTATGEFSADEVTWETKGVAPVEASAYGSSNGLAHLDAAYKPGQSATGNVILDVGERGGTATFYDTSEDAIYNPVYRETPLFQVALPY